MENGPSEAKDPSGFLSEIIGAPVTVKLNSGVVYKGECVDRISSNLPFTDYLSLGQLQSVDGYMNIALEDTKEVVSGRVRKNYGDAFIRGNNGERPFVHSRHIRS